MNPILVQTFAYMVVLVLAMLGVSMLLRGFFWTYFKVRTSFGKYVMVKIRSAMRDYFTKGWVEDGFLIYKASDKALIRMSIPSKEKVVYRCLGVNWLDVDEEKNAICMANYSAITGYDAKKFSDLLTRALMRPSINSMQERLILFAVFGALILSAAAAYLSYTNYSATHELVNNLPGVVSSALSNINLQPTATGVGAI